MSVALLKFEAECRIYEKKQEVNQIPWLHT